MLCTATFLRSTRVLSHTESHTVNDYLREVKLGENESHTLCVYWCTYPLLQWHIGRYAIAELLQAHMSEVDAELLAVDGQPLDAVDIVTFGQVKYQRGAVVVLVHRSDAAEEERS